jgi:Putative beta barrel porin-7 (BBP7)
VKRFWLHQFAIAIGLAGASSSLAQYPTYNPNVGPSAYPLQQPAQNEYLLTNWQDPVPSVPAPNYSAPNAPVPDALIPLAAQEPVGHQQYSPSHMAPPVQHQQQQHQHQHQYPQQPAAHGDSILGYQQQAIAPGCSSCGNAPISQGYVDGYGYSAAPGYGSNYAYSAPSVGWGDGHSRGHGGFAHRGPRLANGLPPGAKPYFFGAGVLIFRRIDDNNKLLSESDAGGGVLYTGDAKNPTMGGISFLAGRYFNCGKNAIVASYWGLYPESREAGVSNGAAPGSYRSSIFRPWSALDASMSEFQLQEGPAANVGTDPHIYTLYDDATTHRLTRSSQYHNIEINILGFGVGGAARNFNRCTAGSLFSGTRGRGDGCYAGGCGAEGACGTTGCGECGDVACGGSCTDSRYATGPCNYVAPACGSRLNLTWMGGVRYFNFNDTLSYQASGANLTAIGVDYLRYDVRTRNNLLGFQLGYRADYCMGNRLNLYSTARTGIYGNHATLTSRLGSENYLAYRNGDPTMPYYISRSSNNVAFISDIGAGTGFRISPKWTATVGYQAVIACGVATAPGNIRYQGRSISQTNINADDFLVLHGLNLGALYNF